MSKFKVVYLGRMGYKEGLEIQEKLWELRQNNEIDDALLLAEYNSVLTLGKRGGADNILIGSERLKEMGVEVYSISRGGDVTYHGPGQIVGYPIFDLNRHGRDVKKFVDNMQKTFISLLHDEYRLTAIGDDKKYTGVWVDDKKVTAMGIAVKKGVTMHGFAFNVNTDLDHFKWINPCGITDRGVTSLEELTGEKQDMDKLFRLVAAYFARAYDLQMEECTIENLIRN